MKFYGQITAGEIVYDNKLLLKEFLAKLENEAKVQVEIKLKKPSRSLPQNRLYWEWLNVIQADTGQDADELHEGFKVKFLTDNTTAMPKVKRTRDLDTRDMAIYMEKVRVFTADFFNINLPTPQDLYL